MHVQNQAYGIRARAPAKLNESKARYIFNGPIFGKRPINVLGQCPYNPLGPTDVDCDVDRNLTVEYGISIEIIQIKKIIIC